MDSERTIWQLSVVIEATVDQRDAAFEAVARALCPDDDHSGPCPVPWTTIACRFDDLDPDDKASWQESFDLDRQPRAPGTPGA
jgi:hypothetical protein